MFAKSASVNKCPTRFNPGGEGIQSTNLRCPLPEGICTAKKLLGLTYNTDCNDRNEQRSTPYHQLVDRLIASSGVDVTPTSVTPEHLQSPQSPNTAAPLHTAQLPETH
jgi:hypothetical protein